MEILSTSAFVLPFDPTFYFRLITSDPDDNKFCDVSVVANARCLVTSDRHFDVLKTIEFPKIEAVHPKDFIKKFL